MLLADVGYLEQNAFLHFRFYTRQEFLGERQLAERDEVSLTFHDLYFYEGISRSSRIRALLGSGGLTTRQ